MIVALTGFMASGKTTFGRAAALRLGWRFLDLDDIITDRYGSPAELFSTRGEGYFRDIETQVLAEVLSTGEDTVLALGGGTVLREENLKLLRDKATTVWLDTDFAIILSELGGTDRPLVRGQSIAQVHALYEERRVRYAQAADIVFPVQTTDYPQVIADLTETIRGITA